MSKNELTVYEKVEKCLYMTEEEAMTHLTPVQLEIKRRLMLCVSMLLSDPLKQDVEIVNFLRGGCGGVCESVSQTQAYRDVAALRKMVGSIQLSSKAWYRYMIVEGAKQGIEIAKKNKDSKGIAANLDKIGKYTRADKEDDSFDWSQMLPPVLEPTDDVSVLEGIEPIANLEEERKSFRALFKKEMKQKAEDI
jgi:hypothetical protein